jgi:hypothetical protein
MVIPLMAAAFIGYGASRLVCHEGVYHALAKNFLAAARTLEPSLPSLDQETAPAGGKTEASPSPPANLVG